MSKPTVLNARQITQPGAYEWIDDAGVHYVGFILTVQEKPRPSGRAVKLHLKSNEGLLSWAKELDYTVQKHSISNGKHTTDQYSRPSIAIERQTCHRAARDGCGRQYGVEFLQ